MKAFSFRNPMYLALLQPKVAVPPATDPYFNNVVLLLHMDGSQGGTTFTDSSNSNHTVTAVGNANTETTIKKFGTASLEEDGNGDYLSFSYSVDYPFDLGLSVAYSPAEPFTVEFWARLTNTSATNVFFGKGGGIAGWNSSNGHQYTMFTESSTLYFQWWTSGTSPNTISASLSSLGWSANTWYHVAIAFDGTTTEVYFNGSRFGTSTAAYNEPSSATVFRVGANAAGYSVYGYMDDFRITKGSSRYTGATITVPSASFPDS